MTALTRCWLWDVATRRQIGNALRVPTGAGFGSMAFSPDGKTLAMAASTVTVDGSVGNSAQLWDVATHRQIGNVTTSGTFGNNTAADIVGSIAFSPDGKTLARGGMDGAPSNDDGASWLWNVANGHQIGDPLITGGGPLTSVAFSPDGKTLATGGDDRNSNAAVWLWNVATGHQIGNPLTTGGGQVTSVAFSPDGKTLATGGDDGTARLWDVATHRQTGNPLTSGGGAVTSVAFSPDGKVLASGDEDGTAQLWDVAVAINISTGTPVTASRVVSIRWRSVRTARPWPPRRRRRRRVWLWNVATRHQIRNPLTTGGDEVTSVAFSPDGKTLATSTGAVTVTLEGVASGSAQLWNVATHRQIANFANGGTMASNAHQRYRFGGVQPGRQDPGHRRRPWPRAGQRRGLVVECGHPPPDRQHAHPRRPLWRGHLGGVQPGRQDPGCRRLQRHQP